MKQPSNISILILLFFLSISQNSFSQQNENQLIITKSTKQERSVYVDTDYFIKIKTEDGEKIRGKFSAYTDDCFISDNNDTINFNEIVWIKARKQLMKWQKTSATIALISGLYFSRGTVPAAIIIPAMGGSFIIVLAPIATISASVIGYRTLAGRKYKMKKWDLETKLINDKPISQILRTQNPGISFK